ncbi:MAG: hypothetical protein GX896_00900 [Clostridiales bacterium]|nr:hypothetical protein [Clostridiales bacterium]
MQYNDIGEAIILELELKLREYFNKKIDDFKIEKHTDKPFVEFSIVFTLYNFLISF